MGKTYKESGHKKNWHRDANNRKRDKRQDFDKDERAAREKRRQERDD